MYVFSVLRVNGVFMSLSGLGQDTDTEKNNCLNPKLQSKAVSEKQFPQERDLCDVRQPKSLPASPFALGEHAR